MHFCKEVLGVIWALIYIFTQVTRLSIGDLWAAVTGKAPVADDL